MKLGMAFIVVVSLLVSAAALRPANAQGPDAAKEKCGMENGSMAAVAVDQGPTIKKKVEAKYPELALRSGIEGKVFLKVYIDENGRVEKAMVDSSSNEVFTGSALEAIKGWEFTPAMKDDKPIKAEVIIPFRYKLAGGPRYAVGEEIKSLQEDVLKLLRGESTESVKTKVGLSAYVIVGKADEYLPGLLKDTKKRGKLIEGPKTEVGYFRLAMDDSGDMAYLVMQTRPSPGKVRYHTVIFSKSGEGTWAIAAWQVGG
jgi:TonB family protein